MSAAVRLGVNIDHVATVRNARGVFYPDPVRIAQLAVAAGADGITAHLREDRRHIRDEDILRLKSELAVPLNLEMAATAEMVEIARRVQPHAACIVPEKRTERTTEGGLDVVGQLGPLRDLTSELADAAIRVSLFIEPAREAVDAAHAIGAPVVELHTGSWCNALLDGDLSRADAEFERLRTAARLAGENGIECHAGHGLDYKTARFIARLPQIAELNIGHFLVGEAIAVGIAETVRLMRAAIAEGMATRNTVAA